MKNLAIFALLIMMVSSCTQSDNLITGNVVDAPADEQEECSPPLYCSDACPDYGSVGNRNCRAGETCCMA